MASTFGYSGIYAISAHHCRVDGRAFDGLEDLQIGTQWSWHGEALRVDGPQDLLRLGGAKDVRDLRARVARRIARRARVHPAPPDLHHEANSALGFAVTDGHARFDVDVILQKYGMLLVFQNGIPPKHRDLWILNTTLDAAHRTDIASDVICFAQNTTIKTPNGAVQIGDLRVGDLVCTKDNGPQALQWIGQKFISPARLHVMPALRPMCLTAHKWSLLNDASDLWVSPAHRVLLRGPAADNLFGTPEVLVPARSLPDDLHRKMPLDAKGVTYTHLLFDQHEIIWANGIETESFHPADMPLVAHNGEQRTDLLQIFPNLKHDCALYGPMARRVLSAAETILVNYAA